MALIQGMKPGTDGFPGLLCGAGSFLMENIMPCGREKMDPYGFHPGFYHEVVDFLQSAAHFAYRVALTSQQKNGHPVVPSRNGVVCAGTLHTAQHLQEQTGGKILTAQGIRQKLIQLIGIGTEPVLRGFVGLKILIVQFKGNVSQLLMN